VNCEKGEATYNDTDVQHRSIITSRLRAIAPLIALVLIVVGAGAWWVNRQPGEASADLAQMEARIIAEERWHARPFVQYELLVTWESDRRGRSTQRYLVGESNQPLTGSERTIEDYFGLIAFHQRNSASGCDSTVGACAMAYSRSVQAKYDQRFGYPTQIELTSTSHPDWGNLRFWPWFAQSGAWRGCENPLCSSTSHSVVTIEVLPVAGAGADAP
jgi:hypothetical protein